jgi:hypothetical protein
MNKKTNAVLLAGALTLFGNGAVFAEEPEMGGKWMTAESVGEAKVAALESAKKAVASGKAGNAAELVTNAKAAVEMANNITGDAIMMDVEQAQMKLKEAIEHGQQGHADVATAAAEEAVANLEKAQ